MSSTRECKPPVLLSGTEIRELDRKKSDLRRKLGGNDDEQVILNNGYKKYSRASKKYMIDEFKSSKFMMKDDLQVRLQNGCYLSPEGVAKLEGINDNEPCDFIVGYDLFEDAQSAFEFYCHNLNVDPETMDEDNQNDDVSTSHSVEEGVDNNQIKIKSEYKRKHSEKESQPVSRSNTQKIFTDMTAAVSVFDKQLKRLKSEHDRLEKATVSKTDNIKTLEARVKTSDEEISSLKKHLERSEEVAKNALVARKRDLETQTSRMNEIIRIRVKEAIDRERACAAEKEAQYRALQDKFTVSESKIDDLQNQIKVLKADKIASQSKIANLESVVARFKASAKALFSNIE